MEKVSLCQASLTCAFARAACLREDFRRRQAMSCRRLPLSPRREEGVGEGAVLKDLCICIIDIGFLVHWWMETYSFTTKIR
jgi:hypothetical protein